MKATTSTDITAMCNGKDNPVSDAEQASWEQQSATDNGQGKGRPESELRAAARKRGLTLKQLAEQMDVNYGYLSSVSGGRRPWSPMLRERATALLG